MQLVLLMENVQVPPIPASSLFTVSLSRPAPHPSLPSPSRAELEKGPRLGCQSVSFDSQASQINQMPTELGGAGDKGEGRAGTG